MSRPPKLKVRGAVCCSAFQLPDGGSKGQLAGAPADDCSRTRKGMGKMLRCEELIGKVIHAFSLFEDGPYGPEIQIEFTDGTVFHSCVHTTSTLEAKLLRNSASGSEVLNTFTPQKDASLK